MKLRAAVIGRAKKVSIVLGILLFFSLKIGEEQKQGFYLSVLFYPLKIGEEQKQGFYLSVLFYPLKIGEKQKKVYGLTHGRSLYFCKYPRAEPGRRLHPAREPQFGMLCFSITYKALTNSVITLA